MPGPVTNGAPAAADQDAVQVSAHDIAKLTGAFETLLYTLVCRELDARNPAPILNDRVAVATVARIEATGYHLRFFRGWMRTVLAGTPLNRVLNVVAYRSYRIDQVTERFLAAHPEGATVLHLACALDSRSQRIKWQGKNRLWIDVDHKDVVDLRRKLMDPVETVFGEGEYRLLGPAEYTPTWLADHKVPNDRPVLIIMEGLTMYLPAATNLANLRQFVAHFSGHGGELVFDVVGAPVYLASAAPNRLATALLGRRLTSFVLAWYLNDPAALPAAVPGLRAVRRHSLLRAAPPRSVRVLALPLALLARLVELLLLVPLFWLWNRVPGFPRARRLPVGYYFGGLVQCEF